MSTQITKPVVWLDGYDISGYLNQIALAYGADPLDEGTFADSAKVNVAGLKNILLDWQGWFESGASPDLIDKILNDRLGVHGSLIGCTPATGAAGDRAYQFNGFVSGHRAIEATHGQLTGHAANFASRSDLIRSTILEASTQTTTGTGTPLQLGAVSAGQSVYASIHVTAASTADTLDLKLQSDDAVGFTTPTDQITFTQVTDVTYEGVLSAAGAITDDWWAADWTIAGTDPSFTFVMIVGIV